MLLTELDEAVEALEATSAAIETSSLFVLRAAVLAQTRATNRRRRISQ